MHLDTRYSNDLKCVFHLCAHQTKREMKWQINLEFSQISRHSENLFYVLLFMCAWHINIYLHSTHINIKTFVRELVIFNEFIIGLRYVYIHPAYIHIILGIYMCNQIVNKIYVFIDGILE